MNPASHRSRPRLRVVPSALGTASGAESAELTIARRRMRHLAPWHVAPLPAMHSAAGRVDEPLTSERRERREQLALHVLAVQMCEATAKSALD